ncbi:hypothetical protein D3C71_1786620 [compost metagenome]
MSKWISSKARNGKQRSFDTINIFAINNAHAEQIPFTVLKTCTTGRPCTYNHK